MRQVKKLIWNDILPGFATCAPKLLVRRVYKDIWQPVLHGTEASSAVFAYITIPIDYIAPNIGMEDY